MILGDSKLELHTVRRPGIRTDIQALRGFAVGTVLVFHAASVLMPGGFLGVDVFFVISGYLMAGIITRDVISEKFCLQGFYLRRARRLLPAAYVTFAICASIAPWLLTSLEYADFQKQLLGAITFTSNIVLWQQSGYFAQASALKPLLHTWSLSVEEQYYIFLPAFFMLTPKRFWLKGLSAVTLSSYILYAYMLHKSPNAAFFLLPTRVWELLLGSIGVLITSKSIRSFATRCLLPAGFALVWLTIMPFSATHAAWNALIICTATFLVLLANDQRAGEGRLIGAAAWLGDISYPLYLLHWPLLSFIRSVWITAPPQYILLLAMAACVPLAWIVVNFVERPIRGWLESKDRTAQTTTILIPALCLVAVAFAIHVPSTEAYVAQRRVNHGLSDAC